VAFEWDSNKAAKNFRDHQVRFEEAVGMFSDHYAMTITDDESDPHERRFVTLGLGIKGRLLAVVYTYRGQNIRIISVRKAERHEEKEYEAQL
jgi:uncharacterized DUF497 family protein